MKPTWPSRLLRWLLATMAMVNGLGSPAVLGHVHGQSHAWLDAEHHADWARTHHTHRWLERLLSPCDPTEHEPTVQGPVFHLHGLWFGIPFSAPCPTPHESGQVGVFPPLDACPPDEATVPGAGRAVPKWWWPLRPLVASAPSIGSPASIPDASHPLPTCLVGCLPDPSSSPCALRVPSVIALC